MPHWNWKEHPAGTTQEEFDKILELRKNLMRTYGEDPSTPMPVEIKDRWGWHCRWRLLGRDTDGSLCISVCVHGPRGEIAYARNYRLVKQHPLPFEVGRRLREP